MREEEGGERGKETERGKGREGEKAGRKEESGDVGGARPSRDP